MAVVLAFFGAAVAWLIAAVSIAAIGSLGWALFCVAMALTFSVVAVALWWRDVRRRRRERANWWLEAQRLRRR